MEPLHYIEPDDITCFSPVMRYGSRAMITGKDKNNLTSIPGGKAESYQKHLIDDVLNDELGQEIGATIRPENFGHPDFPLNCVLGHQNAITFWTVTDKQNDHQRLERDPLKFARKCDPLRLVPEPDPKVRKERRKRYNFEMKLRVMVPTFEITGNPLEDFEELKGLEYRELSHKSDEKMRESVRIMLKIIQDGRWYNLKPPCIERPLRLNLIDLRKNWEGISVDPSTIERFTSPSHARSTFQVQAAEHVMM